MYSFTSGRKKELFSFEIKLLLTLFSITFLVLITIESVLKYKVWSFQKDEEQISNQTLELKNSIDDASNEFALIKRQKERYDEIVTNNLFLKDSIKNLFDLIPDKITLTKADLEENKLVLYGLTPTKEVYEFLLLAPLESIFNETYTSYYQLDNGWFRFVSTNIVARDEGKEP